MTIRHALTAAAGNTSPATPTDPQFNYVSMLLHGDGTNGAQNNTFIDSSTNNFTITRNGNTTQGSLSPYGNLWSNWFSGGGSDWLTVGGGMPSGQGTEFTLEFWAYATTVKEHVFTQGTAAGTLDFYVNSSGAVKLDDTGVVAIATSANSAFPYRSWVHIALTRTAGNLYTIYINGVSVGTGTNSTSMTANTTIGKHRGSTSRYFQGYMSNWRVTNTLVYTSNFTPPTAPLTAITNTSLLTCQSNRFRDASANNFTITRSGDVRVTKEAPFLPTAAYSTSVIGGSGYFDGTGDYLSFANSAAFAFGTGDFTVEYWIYSNSFANAPTVVDNRSGVTSTNGYADYFNTTGTFALYIGNTTIYTSASAIPTNTWAHIAVSRSGTSLRVFINGVQSGATVTNSTNLSDQFLLIGTNSGATNSFNGYVANLRLVKGTAVYTSNFTPPTAPLTAITNTSLLLNFINAGIFDNAAENDLETVGNAQISTSVKKYGTGSLAFDGTGDWLQLAPGLNLEMGGGNFTWEFWIYPNSVASSAHILAQQAQDVTMQFDNTSSDQLIVWDGSKRIIGAVSTAQWTHIALVRSSGTLVVYLNGIATGASWSNTSTTRFTLSSGLVGSRWGGTNNLNGCIDDLRITKGYARYTANFTPPTAAFPDQ